MQKIDSWSQYWDSEKLNSCFFSNSGEDEVELIAIWHEFLNNIAGSSHVLDLATGNGYIAKLIFEYKPQLKITGVDLAEINAKEVLKANDISSSTITFLGGVDIANMNFSDSSFDAVTSQFGIEYSTGLEAYSEALRVLKINGNFQFLIHHADSELIHSSKQKYDEMKILKLKNGVLDKFIKFISHKISIDELDQAGQAYLNSDLAKTEQISQQLFVGINQVVTSFENRENDLALLQASNILQRFEAQYIRLEDMLNSAKSKPEMMEIFDHLKKNSASISEMSEFSVGQDSQKALLAWLLKGTKQDV